MINQISEVLYRYGFAARYLGGAEDAFRRSDWRTVIAFYRIPSWTHLMNY